jgi:hypothetical protein
MPEEKESQKTVPMLWSLPPRDVMQAILQPADSLVLVTQKAMELLKITAGLRLSYPGHAMGEMRAAAPVSGFYTRMGWVLERIWRRPSNS